MPRVSSAHTWKDSLPEGAAGWTIPQYAERWQVSRGCVHKWLRDGELSSVKIGGTRRILPEHDHDFRKRHQVGAFVA